MSNSSFKRYFLYISYHGKEFNGWQTQPNKQSVQDQIEKTIAQFLFPVSIVGSGRTDAGVHATGQVAHLDLPESLSPVQFCYKLNKLLPPTIAIWKIREVVPTAHARFDAIARRYYYLVTQARNPFTHERSYTYRTALDLAAMQQGAKKLIGRYDCRSFCKTKSIKKNNICQISHFSLSVESNQYDQQEIYFEVEADRFLHGMVRTLVSILIEIGKGKITPSHIKEIIEKKKRESAYPSMPAKGLTLSDVFYPHHLFI